MRALSRTMVLFAWFAGGLTASADTIEEIVAATKEAGVRAILFNEHPSEKYNYFLDGHRAARGPVEAHAQRRGGA